MLDFFNDYDKVKESTFPKVENTTVKETVEKPTETDIENNDPVIENIESVDNNNVDLSSLLDTISSLKNELEEMKGMINNEH